MILNEKACANTRCGDSFVDKNPKKKFCCTSCKNQAAYYYRQKEYAWENLMFSSRRKNIQILEYLIHKKDFIINTSELKRLGFDFTAALTPFVDANGYNTLRYGNVGMRILSETECELIKF